MKQKIIGYLVLIFGLSVLAACSASNSVSLLGDVPQSAQPSLQDISDQSPSVAQDENRQTEASSGAAGQSAPEIQSISDLSSGADTGLSYVVVDTSQGACYDNSTEITCPDEGAAFYGQDGQYGGAAASYQDNGDGTISDLNTGLMWQQDPGEKVTYAEAAAGADTLTLAGYDDWRLPTIKELYSLILFDGTDVSMCPSGACDATPFIDTRTFDFEYGNEDAGERTIDSQWATSTIYQSTVMSNSQCMFGVNFADGRIKCYPTSNKTYFVIYVRGNTSYGENDFVDNPDGTITDNATGLMWQQADSAEAMTWQEALAYCEDLSLAGYTDWRLPDAKELQSIVDYTRSPDTTHSAAISPLFGVTSIINEAGQTDFPFYWSSTTHLKLNGNAGNAVYVSFGRALGYMNNNWMDVHGAGAQRSDPKTGSAGYHGPQGDVQRVENYARCVRSGSVTPSSSGTAYAARPTISIVSSNSTNLGFGQAGNGSQPPDGEGQLPPQQPAGGQQPPPEQQPPQRPGGGN